MTTPSTTCPRCGSAETEPGFIDDTVNGRVRWLAGPLNVGSFGNTKRIGRTRTPILASRCTGCDRLELFADTSQER